MTTETTLDESVLLEAHDVVKALPEAKSKSQEPLSQTYQKYIRRGDNFGPTPPASVTEKLTASAYRIHLPMGAPPQFARVVPSTDELFLYKDSVLETVLEEIDRFWTLAPKYKQFGFRHTRGILMHGEPGMGKSSAIQQVIERIIQQGDPVFLVSSVSEASAGLQIFREVEPDRKVVVVLEDMDQYIGYAERDLLQLLDGDNAQDGVLFIGTTNYLNKFPPRLQRSGRFDRKVLVGPPNESARTMYFSKKLKKPEEDKVVQELAMGSEGLNFGDLKELVVATQVLGEPVPEVLARLRESPSANESGDTDGDTPLRISEASQRLLDNPAVRALAERVVESNPGIPDDDWAQTIVNGGLTEGKLILTTGIEGTEPKIVFQRVKKGMFTREELEALGTEHLDSLSLEESQMVKHYFDFKKMKGGIAKSTGKHTDDATKVTRHPTIIAISGKLRLIHGKLERESDRKKRVQMVRDYMGPKLARYMKTEAELDPSPVIETEFFKEFGTYTTEQHEKAAKLAEQDSNPDLAKSHRLAIQAITTSEAQFVTGKNDSGSTTGMERHMHQMDLQSTKKRERISRKRRKVATLDVAHIGLEEKGAPVKLSLLDRGEDFRDPGFGVLKYDPEKKSVRAWVSVKHTMPGRAKDWRNMPVFKRVAADIVKAVGKGATYAGMEHNMSKYGNEFAVMVDMPVAKPKSEFDVARDANKVLRAAAKKVVKRTYAEATEPEPEEETMDEKLKRMAGTGAHRKMGHRSSRTKKTGKKMGSDY